jgi:hypothetical protein
MHRFPMHELPPQNEHETKRRSSGGNTEWIQNEVPSAHILPYKSSQLAGRWLYLLLVVGYFLVQGRVTF